jgi:arylsulfatase A-like enzyme
MVNALDTAIGQVVDALKELNLYNDTIIIFSSDVRSVLLLHKLIG